MTTAIPTSSPAQTRRAIWNTIRGSSGNLVEWYDVYIYTVFASYFEGQFFDESEKNSTIYVYAIFAVTFLMRPVGSWFFGRFADRRGRRAALTFSVSLMAACSMVIALVPSQATIGVAAPFILILARLVQGFATGGEYGTSATYMSEAATREPHRLIAATVGVAIPRDKNLYGYLSEHHSFGESEDIAGDYAEELAAEMLATTLGLEFDPDKSWDENKEVYRLSNQIVRTQNVTQTAVGDKKGLWTTVVAAAVLVG